MIDFNACRSIVRRGNGTFGLKPVLTATVMELSEIVGFVDPAIDDVTVIVQKNGTVVRGTLADPTTGEFRLAWLTAADSPYDVVFTAPGRATAVVSGVPVTQGTTVLSEIASPIALDPSDSRVVEGNVDPVEAQDDGAVRALQAVGGVPKIEVATVNVDNDTTGHYSITLPMTSPRLAPYSAVPPALAFAPQDTTAGLYTLEASATDFATQPAPIDLNSGDPTQNLTQDFTLVP